MTGGIEIGVQFQGDGAGPKAFARRAEAAGFDSVWTGDHVAHIVDGLAALALMAGATESITIGLNVLVVPYRPAAVIAKSLATIVLAAPGRVIAGFGVGGEFPEEFVATGAQVGQRGRVTDEALDVIRALWRGQPVTHHGRFSTLDDFTLEPAPPQAPTVWIGGRSDAALRRAVRHGDGYVPYLVSPEQLAARVGKLRAFATEAGRNPDELAVGCLVTFIPGPSVESSVELGLTSLKLSGLTPERVRAQYLLGDDESALARLQDYVDSGATHLILGCLPGPPELVDDFFAAAGRLQAAARALRPA